jgi:7-carboxy-7-deazaguanine synthase
MVEKLTVNEIFASIQGESTRAGLPCAFVRLTACDLRCSYCDTEYAFYEGSPMEISEIVQKVEEYKLPLVEVTGGEPLLQAPVHVLMKELADRGMTVLLETAGAHDISACDPRVVRIMDLKCPSSKMEHRNRWENLAHLQSTDEVKFVIGTREDFDWSAGVVREYRLVERCPVLFSPVWNVLPLTTLADWIREARLPVRLQPQLHKLLWGEKRAV